MHVPVSSSNNREEWRVRQSQRRESKAVAVEERTRMLKRLPKKRSRGGNPKKCASTFMGFYGTGEVIEET